MTAFVRVTIIEAEGSAPRGVGTVMAVTADQAIDTIGGGRLEFEAINAARAMLNSAASGRTRAWQRHAQNYPLGPSLGQCCGGMVRLLFEVMDEPFAHTDGLLVRPVTDGKALTVTNRRASGPWPQPVARVIAAMLSGERPMAPVVVKGRKGEPDWFVEPPPEVRQKLFIYGAGHVGRAIVRVLEGLPFDVVWVDTAADRFPDRPPEPVKPLIAADPATVAAAAPAAAFHLVLTYSHALDLAICHALLKRNDFQFLGLIGSKTKRARFSKRLREAGVTDQALGRLTSPIGLPLLKGKSPAVIAIAVAAELMMIVERAASGVAENEVISSA